MVILSLGNAYANLYDLGNNDAKETAIQHLCRAAEEEHYREWAIEITVALGESCP